MNLPTVVKVIIYEYSVNVPNFTYSVDSKNIVSGDLARILFGNNRTNYLRVYKNEYGPHVRYLKSNSSSKIKKCINLIGLRANWKIFTNKVCFPSNLYHLTLYMYGCNIPLSDIILPDSLDSLTLYGYNGPLMKLSENIKVLAFHNSSPSSMFDGVVLKQLILDVTPDVHTAIIPSSVEHLTFGSMCNVQINLAGNKSLKYLDLGDNFTGSIFDSGKCFFHLVLLSLFASLFFCSCIHFYYGMQYVLVWYIFMWPVFGANILFTEPWYLRNSIIYRCVMNSICVLLLDVIDVQYYHKVFIFVYLMLFSCVLLCMRDILTKICRRLPQNLVHLRVGRSFSDCIYSFYLPKTLEYIVVDRSYQFIDHLQYANLKIIFD